MDTTNFDYVHLFEEAELLETPVYSGQIAGLIRELLLAFGENPEREGLQRTPERVARMWEEILAGYRTDPVALVNEAIFDTDYEDTVLIRDIEFYSMCEHHLLPFFGRVHIAYIPDGKVLGLSKFPRVVDMFARRLQIQEQMTQQIARFLESILQPKGLAVVVEGAHLCAMMRGVKKSDVRMLTSTTQGVFKDDVAARQELMAQIQRGDGSKGPCVEVPC